jgi:hypothetical protein
MAKKKKDKTEPKAASRLHKVEMRIGYRSADSMRATFANHLVVQHDRGTFYLLFYEALPPMLIGTDEEKESQFKSIEAIPAHCVAKVAIPADRMESFVRVLAENFNNQKQVIEAIMAEAIKANGSKNGK